VGREASRRRLTLPRWLVAGSVVTGVSFVASTVYVDRYLASIEALVIERGTRLSGADRGYEIGVPLGGNALEHYRAALSRPTAPSVEEFKTLRESLAVSVHASLPDALERTKPLLLGNCDEV